MVRVVQEPLELGLGLDVRLSVRVEGDGESEAISRKLGDAVR